MKPADKYTLPLCRACHRHQHQIGEPAFYSGLGIDALDVSLRLWCISGDIEQGRRCIEKARARMRLTVLERVERAEVLPALPKPTGAA